MIIHARNKGFSLLEVTMAMTIFILILVGLLAVYSQGYFYFQKTKFKIPGYNLARGVIEEHYDWNTLDLLDGADDNAVANADHALADVTMPMFTSADATFGVDLTIENGPISGLANTTRLKKVTTVVSWPEGNFSLTSLKAIY